jgi:hypothetical protein
MKINEIDHNDLLETAKANLTLIIGLVIGLGFVLLAIL